MRRTLAHSPTRGKLLDAAERLMVARGFAATTLEEICRAAKMTKGCFFHYFESKEHLGRAVLERFCDQAQKEMEEALSPDERDPLRRVYARIDLAIRMSRKCPSSQGCLLGTLAQELSETHPEIRSLCARGFERWAQAFQKEISEAKARYRPRSAIDPRSLAEYFIAVLEGSKILAKTQRNGKVVEKNLRLFQQYLKGLFGRSI